MTLGKPTLMKDKVVMIRELKYEITVRGIFVIVICWQSNLYTVKKKESEGDRYCFITEHTDEMTIAVEEEDTVTKILSGLVFCFLD